MSSSIKKSTCKGTLRDVFICLRLRNPYPPPPIHTVSVHTVYLFTQGRGGELTRDKIRGATVHKAGSNIPTWLTVSPVYKLWKTPATKPLYRSFFRWRHFALTSMSLTFFVVHQLCHCFFRNTVAPNTRTKEVNTSKVGNRLMLLY